MRALARPCPWLTLVFALLLGSAGAVPVAASGAGSSLPPALYLGAESDPVVTPAQAREVVGAWWPLRQRALTMDDVGLTRELEAGPAVEHDVFVSRTNRGYTAAGQPTNASVRMNMSGIQALSVTVPRQGSLPAHFMAQVTTAYGTPRTPLQDLLVFERPGSGEPWRMVFEIAYLGQALPPVLISDSGPAEDRFATPAAPPSWMDPATLPGLVARYWQSWRDAGGAPSGSNPLADGYMTTERGQLLAGEHARIAGLGIDDHERFSVDPHDAIWQFSAALVADLYCFTIRATYDQRPASPAALLLQPQSRRAYGGGLAPGRYTRIVTRRAWEACAAIPISNNPSGFTGPSPTGIIELVGDPGDEDVDINGSLTVPGSVVAILVLWGGGDAAATVVLLFVLLQALAASRRRRYETPPMS